MICFGHALHPDIASQYKMATLGIKGDGKFEIALHTANGCYSPMIYRCAICRRPYVHWLCSDKIWKILPVRVQRKKVCLESSENTSGCVSQQTN
jgi:hypothetical protein